MKTLKIIGGTLGGLIALCIFGACVWILAYVCIQPVKDWTNENVFHIEEAKEDETENNDNEVVVDSTAKINFANKILKVEI